MLTLATTLCWAMGLAVLVLSVALFFLSDTFFGNLARFDPTLDLPQSSFYFGGGSPVHPQRVRYLESKAYLALPAPLGNEGRRVHLWLRVHTVTMLALVLCIFWLLALAA